MDIPVRWTPIAYWPGAPPTRRAVARAIRLARACWPRRRLTPAQSRLGLKGWIWDPSANVLRSPFRRTLWPTAALQAHSWSDAAAVEGETGIHAYHLPRDWRRAWWQAEPWLVLGLVERFGRAVVGPTGWRAEHVVIRALIVPTPAWLSPLQLRYPGIPMLLSVRLAAPGLLEGGQLV